jgi:hypothetical protein
LNFSGSRDQNAGVNGELPKIEILAPFVAAYEWMKAILFRPFDLARWLTIAFAAFLAGSWGSGLNFRWGQWGRGDFKYRLNRYGDVSDWTVPAWLIGLIVLGGLVAIVFILVWMWITARGRFIFTDCVVRNRAAIAEPWRQFRREGNSYFLFFLAVGFALLVLTAILVVIGVAVFGVLDRHQGSLIALVAGLMVLGALWLLLALFFALVSHCMVPVMYRRRCSAREAFVDVTKLVFHNPAPFILFVLFGIALVLAVAIVGSIVACLTCCIGGLPYISTALLLPAIVWLAAYKLLFLRQFGDPYDVWAAAGLSSPATEPSVLPSPPVGPAG